MLRAQLLEAAEQLEKQTRAAVEERASLIRMHDAHDGQLKAQLVATQQELAEAQRQLQQVSAAGLEPPQHACHSMHATPCMPQGTNQREETRTDAAICTARAAV